MCGCGGPLAGLFSLASLFRMLVTKIFGSPVPVQRSITHASPGGRDGSRRHNSRRNRRETWCLGETSNASPAVAAAESEKASSLHGSLSIRPAQKKGGKETSSPDRRKDRREETDSPRPRHACQEDRGSAGNQGKEKVAIPGIEDVVAVGDGNTKGRHQAGTEANLQMNGDGGEDHVVETTRRQGDGETGCVESSSGDDDDDEPDYWADYGVIDHAALDEDAEIEI